MVVKITFFVLITAFVTEFYTACFTNPPEDQDSQSILTPEEADSDLVLGAERMDTLLSLLAGKRVALVVNQTSRVGDQHLVDTLLSKGIHVKQVFAPEHGFRGTADAGEKVEDGKDASTGLPIISLYGKNKKPTAQQLQGIDIVVFDIQDVGVRFYTYISTMHYVMEACAEQGKSFIVLDRPNPNGSYVDGPILEPEFSSFVGMHPIPVVHGMTVGELARMINGEGWLAGGIQCSLQVIPMKGWTHQTRYELPIPPSPNLPNQRAIYLYPGLCFFEGTVISVGRGTDWPFQVWGHPNLPINDFQFIPQPNEGARYPKLQGQVCRGRDLSSIPLSELFNLHRIDLRYLLEAYRKYPDREAFFLTNGFFDKLAGTDQLRKQILAGKSEEEIRASWEEDLYQFVLKRIPYRLYP
jgi:uncharacterized protein YbbC (DUF1343 family)